ncbi:MAG: S-methyl-5'-thioadenosine phosphorylase [Anaerolineae bacterium]|nr:S-methyl-5'-thioadenosine phosphorylase [Anaerolineae bacterium]
MESVRIGVIGGSGLYKMEELTDLRTYDLETPFGKPSAPIVVGTLRGHRVAFIPRHGIGHRYMPSEVPYRANIFALKLMGVTHIIGVSACGSLQATYAPGHMVIPDQLVDLTYGRPRTFFGDGLVAHVSVAEPFAHRLSQLLYESVRAVGGIAHRGGTFLTVEGPRFSTRGESFVFRQWGMGLIGMTTSPEAYLAREAEMHYAVIGHVTDYDSWHESEEPVTVEMVVATMQRSIAVAQQAVAHAVAELGANPDAYTEEEITNALKAAFITNREVVPAGVVERLRPIIGKYFS